MTLVEYDLMGNKRDKVQIAIDRLKAFCPEEGYYVAFSGGKDSQCIYHLCEVAGVKFDAHYNITSVDPPELVQFIKKRYPMVSRDFPRDSDGKVVTMWSLIPRKRMPPTRLVRYCCELLKEQGGKGRVVVTGVRWAESVNRRNRQGVATIVNVAILNDDNADTRRMVEQCYRTNKTLVNPIVDWEDADVWEYLNDVAKVPHCELYDQGYKRLGCIGCPMSSNQTSKLDENPKIRDAYLRSFGRMIKARKENGLATVWETPDEVMYWWTHKANKQCDGQTEMEIEKEANHA